MRLVLGNIATIIHSTAATVNGNLDTIDTHTLVCGANECICADAQSQSANSLF